MKKHIPNPNTLIFHVESRQMVPMYLTLAQMRSWAKEDGGARLKRFCQFGRVRARYMPVGRNVPYGK